LSVIFKVTEMNLEDVRNNQELERVMVGSIAIKGLEPVFLVSTELSPNDVELLNFQIYNP
jgi:hypothetical protein